MPLNDINPYVVFEVKLEKDRGIVVLTIRKEEEEEVHFFRFHHQPLSCHPEQLQAAIRSNKVTARTKSVTVNIYGYCAHYWNGAKNYFEFKGVQLNSNVQQLRTVMNTRINKEIGVLKRKASGGTSRKEAEIEALKEKNDQFEKEFQEERAKRIAAAMADIQKKTTDEISSVKESEDK